jgi:hypothetical protein
VLHPRAVASAVDETEVEEPLPHVRLQVQRRA